MADTPSPRDLFTKTYFEAVFSDCIESGAELREDRGVFTLKFPDSASQGPFYVSFTLEDGEEGVVKLFSDVEGFAGELPAEDFLSGLDILSAKLLTVSDGIDRGV